MKSEDVRDVCAIFGAILLIAMAIFVGPFVTILALQALGLPIELNVYTWLSVAWITFLLKPPSFSGAKKKND